MDTGDGEKKICIIKKKSIVRYIFKSQVSRFLLFPVFIFVYWDITDATNKWKIEKKYMFFLLTNLNLSSSIFT